MSGLYPYKNGIKTVIHPNVGMGLDLKYTLLPELLKNAGYKTHMLGKWHLGFCKKAYTPTQRGFDTFYGFYCGNEDYFSHTIDGALDFRDYETPVTDKNGVYSTYLLRDRAKEIISDHNPAESFFMYLAFQNVHGPLQVTENYKKMYEKENDPKRRIKYGMITAMDDAVGAVFKALEDKGILDNTIIVFSTDNGAVIGEGGSNFPLRGGKYSLWEGGTRATAFVYGKMFQKTKFTYQGLTHGVDWLPTFAEVAGANSPEYDIDGMSMWKAITENTPSPRDRLVYAVYTNRSHNSGSAIRVGDWKLIDGCVGPHQLPADSHSGTYLFNLKDDPTESTNLANSAEHQEKLNDMKDELKKMAASEVDDPYPEAASARGDPVNGEGVWSPGWC